jgi:hypothetical protein
MSKPKSVKALSTRLAALLVEAMNHPQHAEVLEATAQAAFEDSGAEARHTGDLVIMLAMLGRHLADAGEGDLSELSSFYIDEARFPGSDHKPGDCLKYSTEYDLAASAYGKAGIALTKVADDLESDLRASGI